METAHDSIKYIMPVYSKKSGMAGEYPYGVADEFEGMGNRFDDGNVPKNEIMYESTESRYATEMVNASIANGSNGDVKITVKEQGGKYGSFGKKGENYIDGYTEVYGKDINGNKVMLAMQTQGKLNDEFGGRTQWLFNPNGFNRGNNPKDPSAGDARYRLTAVTAGDHDYVFHVEYWDGKKWVDNATQEETDPHTTEVDISAEVFAYARYNSETDLMGNYLGEVELVMKDYHFRPRPITLGVTWTQLTELVLDTSFGLSAEEMLMDAAAQEIKKTLDYQSIKFANGVQQVQGNRVVEFDAEPPATDRVTTKDSYWHTAQLIQQAIDAVGDAQLDKIGRGGVTSIVGGTAAVNYLKLNKGWTDRGRQPKIGAHKVGELDGMSVFKVPSNVIPSDELLTVWKNEANDSDVAVAIGTLLPFYSTGSIQRKNLYKEAAVARFEDTKALQPDYLGKIKINNLRMAH